MVSMAQWPQVMCLQGVNSPPSSKISQVRSLLIEAAQNYTKSNEVFARCPKQMVSQIVKSEQSLDKEMIPCLFQGFRLLQAMECLEDTQWCDLQMS